MQPTVAHPLYCYMTDWSYPTSRHSVTTRTSGSQFIAAKILKLIFVDLCPGLYFFDSEFQSPYFMHVYDIFKIFIPKLTTSARIIPIVYLLLYF